MSGMRGVPPANKELVKELDARAKKLFSLRTRGAAVLVPIGQREKWRKQKAARMLEADQWIAEVRSRKRP